jgi:plastocyanin
LIVAGRGLSDPFESGNPRFAVAGGATIRLGQYVALAGDVASLTDRDSTERVAWSAGVHFAIPLTPHTISIHATNAPVATLQGSSRGTSTVRYGFEFTIPLTLRRYFGKRTESSPDSVSPVAMAVDSAAAATPVEVAPTSPVVTLPAPAPAPVSPPATDTARTRTTPPRVTASTTTRSTTPPPSRPPAKPAARMVNTGMKNINYLQPRLQVTVGTTIEWKNNDPLPHTVTAVDKSFNSGLIQPGKTYRHTFTKAGTFNFYCIPHPFMKGVVVVTGQ